MLIGFLIMGLLASHILGSRGRSSRLGFVLGLGLHFVGVLLTALIGSDRDNSESDRSQQLEVRDWLAITVVIIVGVMLSWFSKEIITRYQFEVMLFGVLMIVGLIGIWTKHPIGKLPLALWLTMGSSAGIIGLIFGDEKMILGAYVGAWVWIVTEFVIKWMIAFQTHVER